VPPAERIVVDEPPPGPLAPGVVVGEDPARVETLPEPEPPPTVEGLAPFAETP
jgi:hypothetical protein